MGKNSSEVKDPAGSPGICQTERTYVLHIIALLLSLSHAVAEWPSHSFQSRKKQKQTWRRAGPSAGLLTPTVPLCLGVLRKVFTEHGVRLGKMSN